MGQHPEKYNEFERKNGTQAKNRKNTTNSFGKIKHGPRTKKIQRIRLEKYDMSQEPENYDEFNRKDRARTRKINRIQPEK